MYEIVKFIARGGEMMDLVQIIISILLLIVGVVAGYFIRKSIAEQKIAGAKDVAEKILADANRDADSLKKKPC